MVLSKEGITIASGEQRISTFWSLGINAALALVLTFMTIRGDSAYYALMLLPVLEASFRLGLGATIAVAILADFICFFGAYGLKFGEYIESGAMSVIYTVMAILVWLLVNNLREREARFVGNLRSWRGLASGCSAKKSSQRLVGCEGSVLMRFGILSR